MMRLGFTYLVQIIEHISHNAIGCHCIQLKLVSVLKANYYPNPF
jgi:hypothetical protein